jgi:CDP-diacylglycerol--serine O-phosphatidyltransferase
VLWPLFVVYGLSGYVIYLVRLVKGKPVSIIQTDDKVVQANERL